MIIPIRCFSCGAVVADKYEKFKERTKKEDAKKVLDSLGIERYCCRRMILSQADFIDEVIQFEKMGP
ncbi:DNA-directed RNA polymerase subunit N [archaeon]|nr:DNA-directed RNA polymerase subunit N [archaeon]